MTNSSPLRPVKPTWGLAILAGLFFFGLAIEAALVPISPVLAAGQDPPLRAPEPTAPLPSPRLNKPILPAKPTMADKGSLPYWGICLSCHGDKGQGLTDEWRQAGFGLDMNCWQSKCHAPNHPTPGFVFPRIVPPVIGPNTLLRFTNARELKDYIKTSMPWWDPGSLSEEDSWNLTAYLLRQNGVLPPNTELIKSEAIITPVHLPIRPRENEFYGQFFLAGLLGLATVLLAGKWIRDSRTGYSEEKVKSRPNFFLHLHPPTIPWPQARWRYTLGAGGIAIFLTVVVTITGILEMFYYTPTPAQAGLSIQLISFSVPFGGLIRGLHFWAAQGLVIVAGIHLLRVIFTGSYLPPRRFNFLLGLGLFVLLILLDFTGYILRWDNGIHWALIVGTNLLKTIPWLGDSLYRFVIGGDIPGLATLIRFYFWHILGLTIILVVVLLWHIFRVRRDGGIAAPNPDERSDPRRISRLQLVRREVFAMLIASASLILIATLAPPPLAAPILDASMPLNPDVRAPWFFLWVQYLLRNGNAFWMGIVVPIGSLAVLISLPYLFPRTRPVRKGSWFPRDDRLVQILVALMAVTWMVLTLLELYK